MTEISGDRITVENHHGNSLYVSRDIIEKMSSGSHFSKEVPTNMTGLAEVLQKVSDAAFTVQFRR